MAYKATTKEVTEILMKKPVYNASLINVIERDCHDECGIVGDSVRIRDKVSGVHMFSVGSWEEVEVLISEVEDHLDTFLINDAAYTDQVRQRYSKAKIKEYQSLVLFAKDYKPLTELKNDIEVIPLDLSWLDFVMELYADEEFGHEAYIIHRILEGKGLGLLYKGQKAAFCLMHKNGESGGLVVHPLARGMGIGTYLMHHLNEMVLKYNKTLVCLVAADNKASTQMVLNSGYQLTDRHVIWVYRKLHNKLYLP